MQYTIEQYPKNKDFDVSKLNEYQIFIRDNQKIYSVLKGSKELICKSHICL